LILFFLWCITLNSQVARRKRGTIGKVFSLVVVCFLSIGTYYIAKTNDVIGMITGGSFRVDNMVVAVLADDPAEGIEDAADYTVGIQLERARRICRQRSQIFRMNSVPISIQLSMTVFRNRPRLFMTERLMPSFIMRHILMFWRKDLKVTATALRSYIRMRSEL